jgi:hypothetical protein
MAHNTSYPMKPVRSHNDTSRRGIASPGIEKKLLPSVSFLHRTHTHIQHAISRTAPRHHTQLSHGAQRIKCESVEFEQTAHERTEHAPSAHVLHVGAIIPRVGVSVGQCYTSRLLGRIDDTCASCVVVVVTCARSCANEEGLRRSVTKRVDCLSSHTVSNASTQTSLSHQTTRAAVRRVRVSQRPHTQLPPPTAEHQTLTQRPFGASILCRSHTHQLSPLCVAHPHVRRDHARRLVHRVCDKRFSARTHAHAHAHAHAHTHTTSSLTRERAH